jgi:hypothetical protein
MLIIAGPLESSAYFMEPETPLPCSQDTATGLCPESDESLSNSSFFLDRNTLLCQSRLGLQSDFIIAPLNTKTCMHFSSVPCVLHVLTHTPWCNHLSIISARAQTMKFFIAQFSLVSLWGGYLIVWCLKIHGQSKRSGPHSWSFGEVLINCSQWRSRMLQNLKQNVRLHVNNI